MWLFHGCITGSNPVGVICRWTLCDKLKSIPTKISNGITSDRVSCQYDETVAWRYATRSMADTKETIIATVARSGCGEVRFLRLVVRLQKSMVHILFRFLHSSVGRAHGAWPWLTLVQIQLEELCQIIQVMKWDMQNEKIVAERGKHLVVIDK